MDQSKRGSLAMGLLLILAGAFFLLTQFYPAFNTWVDLNLSWPWFVIGVGVLFFIFGFAFMLPGMLVAACVIGGIGGLLYWQNMTGNWTSWSYAWTLIPGFSGVGILLASILDRTGEFTVLKGLDTIFTSLIMFLIFGSFLGGFNLLGNYWPLLLVLAGLMIVLRTVFRRRPAQS